MSREERDSLMKKAKQIIGANKTYNSVLELAKKQEDYPWLSMLSVPVYKEPVAHIFMEDLEFVLSKKQERRFNDYFGVQTCPIIGDNSKMAVYPWDAEAVLTRMFENKLEGSQQLWD